MTPVVTGHIDWTVLDELTRVFVKAYGRGLDHRRGQQAGPGNRTGHGRKREQEPPEICPATRKRLRDTLLQMSIDLLSGPGGVASCLRVTTLGEPYNSLSQPLDMGAPTPEVPPHLRKDLIAVHRWGWKLTATPTASPPHRTRQARSAQPRTAQPRGVTAPR